MFSLRSSQLALVCVPLRHCRLALAAAIGSLLSLALLLLLLWPPAATVARLPGAPYAVTVDAATHRILLTTIVADEVLALDGPSATILGRVAITAGHLGAVAIDPGSGQVYVATTLSQLLVLAGTSAAPLATITLDQRPVALAVNRVTGRVYVATRAVSSTTAPDTLVVLDDVRQQILAERAIGAGPLRVAVDPSINHVYVTDDASDTLMVLDGTSNALLATLPLGHGHHELAVNARTGLVYVSNGEDRSLSVLDGPHRRRLAAVPMADMPGAVAVNERTGSVYVAAGGAIALLDGATNRPLASVPVGPHPAGLAVDAARDRVYVTDPADGAVWLLEHGRFGHPSARLIAHADQPDPSPTEQEHGCGC